MPSLGEKNAAIVNNLVTRTYTVITRAGLAALSARTGVSGILAQTPDRDHGEGREIHEDETRKTERDEEELVPLNKTGTDCDLIWGETVADGRTDGQREM